jgi:NitT/TauT family transport system substrate-binding protein
MGEKCDPIPGWILHDLRRTVATGMARLNFPPHVVDKAIDAELKYLIPAQSVVTKQDQWKNLMDMQVYLGNAKGTIPFDQIIDNSFADKAVASLK